MSAGTTPAGIQIGSSESALTAAYGNPDKYDRDYDDTEYTYYSTDFTKKIEFKVVNGNVIQIKCELRD